MKPINLITSTIVLAMASSLSADPLVLHIQQQVKDKSDASQFIAQREKINWDASASILRQIYVHSMLQSIVITRCS